MKTYYTLTLTVSSRTFVGVTLFSFTSHSTSSCFPSSSPLRRDPVPSNTQLLGRLIHWFPFSSQFLKAPFFHHWMLKRKGSKQKFVKMVASCLSFPDFHCPSQHLNYNFELSKHFLKFHCHILRSSKLLYIA